MIKATVLKFIRIYQKTHKVLFFFIFPSLFKSKQGICKYRPTCSQYCYDAIEKYGVIKGMGRGIKRVVRCHPFSHGGWDPA